MHTYKSYTRCGEDLKIQQYLEQVAVGTYIDVGASAPVTDSNTYALYERGWRGICIEPQAQYAPDYLLHRPEDIFVNALAGAEEGEQLLHLLHASQLATTSARVLDHWAKAGSVSVESTMLPVVTLNTLIRQHGLDQIHLLSIDVEGAEKAVLDGIDLDRHRPWLMVIEAVLPWSNIPTDAEWCERLAAHAYVEIGFDGYNKFYAAKERAT